ncbi:MAG: hypothetical protein L0Y55_08890 [Anaerolineales bacterium]|nr:hypothetical protein [Anaerolineales bacterium]
MPILDQPLEFTPNGIPVSLRPFFQEYVLEKLDLRDSAFVIMERALAWGTINELRWLFALYGAARLKEFVQKYGARLLPRWRYKFWIVYFDLPDRRRPDRIWPH